MKKELFSPLEVARALGVSQASIKRWVDKGIIEAIKTAGGHRKISLAAIRNYIEENQAKIINPEALGLPQTSGRASSKRQKAEQDLLKDLIECNETAVEGIIHDLFLSGITVEEIFDDILLPSLVKLRIKVAEGELDPFQESRCIQICVRLQYSLQKYFPSIEGAPVALLGSLSGDHQSLTLHMLEVCLRQHSWHTELLGTDLSAASYIRALKMFSPQLLLLSVGSIASEENFRAELKELDIYCNEHGIGLILFGLIPKDIQSNYEGIKTLSKMSSVAPLLKEITTI